MILDRKLKITIAFTMILDGELKNHHTKQVIIQFFPFFVLEFNNKLSLKNFNEESKFTKCNEVKYYRVDVCIEKGGDVG